VCSLAGFSQNMQEYECYTVLKSKKEIKQFLYKKYGFDKKDFEDGDIIADIGAGNGYVSGMISVFYDDLSFHIQDIDSNCCNEIEVKKVFDHYADLKEENNCSYNIIIGEPHKSCLPENTFNKIIMCSVFHFLTEPYEFFNDIHSKLIKGGKLYIINFFTDNNNTRSYMRHDENVYYEPILEEIVDPIEKAGFKLIELKKNKYSSYNKIVFIKL
jgi:ubiquinone/menaquinone biosynthesis C-methylase UbiE